MTALPEAGQPPVARHWHELSFEDLLASPVPTPEVVAEVRHQLGLDSARRVRYPDREMPDVSGLRRELGI